MLVRIGGMRLGGNCEKLTLEALHEKPTV